MELTVFSDSVQREQYDFRRKLHSNETIFKPMKDRASGVSEYQYGAPENMN